MADAESVEKELDTCFKKKVFDKIIDCAKYDCSHILTTLNKFLDDLESSGLTFKFDTLS